MLLSTGAVGFGIVSLLAVELILEVGSNAGFAMVFALLIAAIIWNLAPWFLDIPLPSSYPLSGTMAANRSGLQIGTVRSLLMAWALTLPASIALSALLSVLRAHLRVSAMGQRRR